MISGVTVTVLAPNKVGTDRLNNPVYGEPTRTTVENVLIVPGATADMDAQRPEGVIVDFTLHFPKSAASMRLEGCEVVLPAPYGGTYRIIGEPRPYLVKNTPTSWAMPVEVTVAHG